MYNLGSFLLLLILEFNINSFLSKKCLMYSNLKKKKIWIDSFILSEIVWISYLTNLDGRISPFQNGIGEAILGLYEYSTMECEYDCEVFQSI